VRPFLLPGLLGVALVLDGCVFPSGLRHERTDRPFTFVSWADTKRGHDVLSALSDQAVLLNPAFSIYPGGVQELISVLNHHPVVSATFHGHEHTHAYTYIDETRIPPEGSFQGAIRPFHQFVAGSAGVRTKKCKANRCDYNMPASGFVTVEVNGPRVAVTFYQLGSMDPVNTVRFLKGY
jgi:hypothetical protein